MTRDIETAAETVIYLTIFAAAVLLLYRATGYITFTWIGF